MVYAFTCTSDDKFVYLRLGPLSLSDLQPFENDPSGAFPSIVFNQAFEVCCAAILPVLCTTEAGTSLDMGD